MFHVRRYLISFLLINVAFATGLSTKVDAVQLTFTFSGISSGSIGDTNYSNEPFSISFRADSEDVFSPPESTGMDTFVTSRAMPTFELGDISGVLLEEYTIFNNQRFALVGLGRETGSFPALLGDVLGFSAPELATYDLRRPIGPISASSDTFTLFDSQPTTAGDWSITGLSFRNPTFSAVPEPHTILGSLMVLVLGVLLKRKLSSAQDSVEV